MATDQLLDEIIQCANASINPMPTAEQIRDAVTRYAPAPYALTTTGPDFVVGAAAVFFVRGANGSTIRDVTIPNIPLAGHTLTARLHLTETDWSYGDGSTQKVTTGDLTGMPYTNSVPCESWTVCSRYISHTYDRPGDRTVTVTAFWSVIVSIDGSATQIPVTGGVSRADDAGRAIHVREARAVLVPNR